MNYTLKNDKGQILDTSLGKEPLLYLHGVGALIPGLENELTGKTAGDKLNAVIEPAMAYGEIREDLKKIVPKSGFQSEVEMELGMRVELDTPEGPVLANISKIEGEEVTLDMNHPLAGVTLYFDVEVLHVRDASAKEIEANQALA